MKRILLTLALALWSMAGTAQNVAPADHGTATDAQSRQDRSWLTGLLEDSLSGAGRTVRLDGFAGALSSRATFTRLTISDDRGAWLTIRNGAIRWNRAALLTGRIEIDELSAEEVDLPRLPVTGAGTATPSPEARPFSLPDLPVALTIGRIDAGKVELGAPVLGEAMSFRVAGAMSLADGAGKTRLDIDRLTGPKGKFALTASYANDTQQLGIDLLLDEGQGGLISKKIGLPGHPALTLAVSGDGPLSNFSADVVLSTNGTQRLGGKVILQDTTPEGDAKDGPPEQQFAVNLSGDIAPLLPAEYRKFFGHGMSISAQGARTATGRTELRELAVKSRALGIEGSASVGADGMPTRFDLQATLGLEDNSEVLLPLSGTRTWLRSGDLHLDYDRSKGDGWNLSGALQQIRRGDGTQIRSANLSGSGRIRQGDRSGAGPGAGGTVVLSAAGFGFADPALTQAVGPTLSAKAIFSWQDGQPLRFSRLALVARDFRADANLEISDLDKGIMIAGKAMVTHKALGALSGLAGRTLGGAITGQISGSYTLLSGAFDTDLSITGQDLKFGQAQVDAALAGTSRITLSARRDETGLTLRSFNARTRAVVASARGAAKGTRRQIDLEARLDNAALLAPGFPGPVTASGRIVEDKTGYRLDLSGTGPGNVSARIKGRIAPDFSDSDLSITGRGQTAIANAFINPRSVRGPLDFDLRMKGRPGLPALSGTVTANGMRIVAPNLGMTLEDVNSRIELANGQARLGVTGRLGKGGQISVNGPVRLDAPYNGNLTIRLDQADLKNPEFYETKASGTITMDGPLSGGARIAGKIILSDTELRVPDSGLGGTAPVPEGLTHIGEGSAVRTTLRRAGLLQTRSTAEAAAPAVSYPLDVTISAPRGIFVRGRGLDAELGGSLRVTGTTANVAPIGQFNLVRGRLNILAQRFTLDQGQIALQGALMPWLLFEATTTKGDYTITIRIEGRATEPQVTFSSAPDLPQDEILAQLVFGRSTSKLSAFQAAQLASAAAALAGKGGEGIFSKLRKGFGLDDLDVATDADGNTSLKAGKYLSRNLYTDVTVGGDGTSKINLNLDVNKTITARGTVGADGSSGIGLYFEKDY